MKAVHASAVLNVVLAFVLVGLVLFSVNTQGNVSTGIVSRSRMAAPVNMRIAPSSRSVSAFAHSNEKQIAVRPRPVDLAPNKIRLRVGAPLATAATVGVCNLANTFPALAAGGLLFDFDLTLPYMATEIVLLSFFLDKLWFGPLSKVIDQRNGILKANLESASGNLEECDQIISFAEKSINNMRATINSERNEKLAALNAECEAAMAASKDKVNKEIEAALSGIEKDRTVVLESMAQEVEGFCWEIMAKVLDDSEMKDIKAMDDKLFKVAA
mmetsp:Transcript_20282/g.33355  ORF Transcript_20282/g.33355 Transcript_20282/m.33355 type:complete len:271 (-) Transcript_20282:134-946(-)